jgi:FkbM family methyltransferase
MVYRVSHIRTFRAGLYHKIQDQDKEWSCMKDKNGNWYTITYDVAMFLPMLEMAGFEHVKHNAKPLYIYNRDNPISDDKVNQQKQWDIHEEILNKPAFHRINSYLKSSEKILVYCGINNGEGLKNLVPFYDKIYAFDANPKKIEICKKVFAHETKITFVEAALHEKDNEEVSFFITEKWDAASSLGKLNPEYSHVKSEDSPLYEADKKNVKEIKVKTLNLNNYLKSQNINHIDYLLTDLQGYDFAVLKTLEDFINNKKISYITCEVEENDSEKVYLDVPSNKKKLFDELLKNNYEELTETRSETDGWTTDFSWKLKNQKEND